MTQKESSSLRRNLEPLPMRGLLVQLGVTLIVGLSTGYIGVWVAVTRQEATTTTSMAYISKSLDENHQQLLSLRSEIETYRQLQSAEQQSQIFILQRLDKLEMKKR